MTTNIDCFISGHPHVGSIQMPPFRDCPICGTDIHVIEDLNRMTFFIQCPTCCLVFGIPYGYSSRLDMANDWNHRHHEK